jgi:hypothetical protein
VIVNNIGYVQTDLGDGVSIESDLSAETRITDYLIVSQKGLMDWLKQTSWSNKSGKIRVVPSS